MPQFFLPNDGKPSKYTPNYLPLLLEKAAHPALETVSTGFGEGAFYPLHLGSAYRLNRTLSPKNPNGLFVYNGLRPNVWAEIEALKGRILIDHIVEAFFGRPDLVKLFHEGIDQSGIEPDRVVLLNGNLISDTQYKTHADALGIERRAHVLPYNGCYWLVRAHNQAIGERAVEVEARAEAARNLLGSSRPKKFVSFNGKGRPHRTYIVLRMLAEGYLEKGLVSLLGHEADENPTPDAIATKIARYPEADRLRSFIPELLARMPLSIDVSREDSRRGAALKTVLPWASPDPSAYDQTYFSVVLDTSFNDPGTVFLTPIAYKSFMNFSPFVYFGNRGGLHALKDTGFMSFSPFIDESYDDIEDNNARLTAAYAEFERLCALSDAQLNEGLASIWPALEHNYELIHRPLGDDFIADWKHRVTDRLPPI